MANNDNYILVYAVMVTGERLEFTVSETIWAKFASLVLDGGVIFDAGNMRYINLKHVVYYGIK